MYNLPVFLRVFFYKLAKDKKHHKTHIMEREMTPQTPQEIQQVEEIINMLLVELD